MAYNLKIDGIHSQYLHRWLRGNTAAGVLGLLVLLAGCGSTSKAVERPGPSGARVSDVSTDVDLAGLQLFSQTFAGSYLDGSVTVLLFTAHADADAAAVARRAGLASYRPGLAQFSLAKLQAAAQTLESPALAQAGVSAVSIDERANRVDLTASSSAAAAHLLSQVDGQVVAVTIGTARVAVGTETAP